MFSMVTLCMVLIGMVIGAQIKVGQVKQDGHDIYFRTQIETSTFFSNQSDFSIVILTCDNLQGIRRELMSIAIYNTKRINRIYINERCPTQSSTKNNYLQIMPTQIKAKDNSNNYNIHYHVQTLIKSNNYACAMEETMRLVSQRQKYIMLMNDQWHIMGPYGFVEKSIILLNSLKYEILGVAMHPQFPLVRQAKKTSKDIQYYSSNDGDGGDRVVWMNSPLILDRQIGYTKMISKAIEDYHYKCDNIFDISCFNEKVNEYLVNSRVECVGLGGNNVNKAIKQQQIHYYTAFDYAMQAIMREVQNINLNVVGTIVVLVFIIGMQVWIRKLKKTIKLMQQGSMTLSSDEKQYLK